MRKVSSVDHAAIPLALRHMSEAEDPALASARAHLERQRRIGRLVLVSDRSGEYCIEAALMEVLDEIMAEVA